MHNLVALDSQPGSYCRPDSIPAPDSVGCQRRRRLSTRPKQTVFWGLSFYIYLTSFVNFFTLLHPIVSRLVLWSIISVIGLNVCDLLEFNKLLTTQGFSINSIFAGFWLTFSWPLKCAFSVYPITLELVFVNYILLKSQRVNDYCIASLCSRDFEETRAKSLSKSISHGDDQNVANHCRCRWIPHCRQNCRRKLLLVELRSPRPP